MSNKSSYKLGSFSLILAILGLFDTSLMADGLRDGRIQESYGSTRAIDSGNDVTGDGECGGSAGRGNLMDFFAMSVPGTSGGTNDPWYFAWTVDSSQALDDTAGNFFGNSASNKVNYIIGIEVNCDGAPRLEMWQNGQPWEREFAWNVDYFIAMFATGPNAMEAQLWRNDGSNARSLVIGGISVTSRVVGFRRQMEFVLPATNPVPETLRNNSNLCLYLLSVKDIDGAGTVIDGVGLLNHNVSCEGPAFDLGSLGSVFINTAAACKESGRPTDAGFNDRQCLSNSRRDTTSGVTGEDCTAPFGIGIDGIVDPQYVLLSESAYAAPYGGGSSASSDFVGESSARTYTYMTAGSTSTVELAGGQHGDIANVYAYADTNYLYLTLTGPTSLGWDNEPDRFNVYIAIDMPGKSSGNDSGSFGDGAPASATAPANRLVNFKGWDPDYAVELVWRAVNLGTDHPANLYASTGPGIWSAGDPFLYQYIPNTAVSNTALYYNRSFPRYEFAIPWPKLGRSSNPSPNEVIRLGAYTTGDENIESANQSAWDIADQAPGIGQGCGGEGCHERVGDDARDDDSIGSTGIGDHTPYVGRSYGNPSFVPATDNATNDIDTIEEYFAFTVSVSSCLPGVDIEKATNGEDADSAPGPLVAAGSNVVWTYVLHNTGSIALTNVVVHDNVLGFITNLVSGDINGNRVLETNEVWTFAVSGFAVTGYYANIGTVTGRAINAAVTVSDADPSHYLGLTPGIDIEKATNGEDADAAPGPTLGTGNSVVWTYSVANTGNAPLTNVVVTDDRIGVVSGPSSGDGNSNGLLDPGEVWQYSATGTVSAGQYVNTGRVTAVSLLGQNVSDVDPSHYFGGQGGIDIEKATNGQDADTQPGPGIPVGSIVTWTYTVRNTGNVALTNIVVSDDQVGAITNLVAGDINGNHVLETNETWVYSKTGIAQYGQYVNIGAVTGQSVSTAATVTDSDPSHYFGLTSGFTLSKTLVDPTNRIPIVGEQITFALAISNTGMADLVSVPVTDIYETNFFLFASASHGGNGLTPGFILWTNVGPIGSGGSKVLTATFTARAATSGYRTNLVVASPVVPTNYPPVPPLTNGAAYNIDEPAQLGDFVWNDLNADGIQQGGETGVAGVVVSLYNAASNVIAAVTTGVHGAYAFTNLVPGTYFVAFAKPAGAASSPVNQGGNEALDSDADGVSGRTAPVSLASGEINHDVDAGFYFPAAIGDFVWNDLDQDGVQDIGEPGLPGVVVTLYDVFSNAVGSVTTTVSGAYAFTNLVPGAYSVGFSQPSGFVFSPPDAAGNDAADSDVLPVTGHTPAVILSSGEYDNTVDAGMYQPAGVGDYVWFDFNRNGIQDQDEGGYGDIIVQLYSSNHVLVGVTTSSLSGAYAFTNLLPGSYYIKVSIPLGIRLSPSLQGNDNTVDSDIDPLLISTAVFTLAPGEFNPTIDIGVYEPFFLAQVKEVSPSVGPDGRCVLVWETASEYGTAGWYVERESISGDWRRVSDYLPSSGSVADGARYQWPDMGAESGRSYCYRLVELDVWGSARDNGPYCLTYSDTVSGEAPSSLADGYAVTLKVRPTKLKSHGAAAESAPVSPVIAVKVSIRDTGLYRVPVGSIAGVLGLTTAVVTAAELRVEHLGIPVPATRIDGDILFYAERHDSFYTEDNIYLIRLHNGYHIPTKTVAPAAAAGPASFPDERQIEQQVALRPDLFDTADADLWLWHLLISGIHTQFNASFDLPALLPGSGGQLSVRMKGASQSSGNGFHGVRIALNNTVVGTNSFFGLKESSFTVDVPPGLLVENGNQLSVMTDPPPGVTRDSLYLDRFAVSYERRYIALSNELLFTAPAGPIQIGGFNTSTIEVWEISDRWHAVRLTGFGNSGAGTNNAVNLTAITNGVHYIASSFMRNPAAVAPLYANDLKSVTNKADYLVIFGAGLSAGAQTLAADRQAKGLRVKVVSVESIFDAFNHGIRDGRALKAFLGYAYRQWQVSPRYVVLLGDGSLDYLNRSGAGDSLVPTPPQATPVGDFASDHSLGDVDNDGYLEMAVGRVPVTTSQQLDHYLAKLFSFEQGGGWRNDVLISTDNTDSGGIYINDGNVLEGLITNRTVKRADIGVIGAAAVSTELQDTLESGHEMMIYVGHGSLSQLADEGVLTTAMVASFTNHARSGVAGNLACLTASFTMPGTPSLGEAMVTGLGGASAMFGSAALVTREECAELVNRVVQNTYDTPGAARLGDAWVDAKNAAWTVGLKHAVVSYQFLGDPAIAIGAPNAPRGGPAVLPTRAGYDEWKSWAFAPVWHDAGLDASGGSNADDDAYTDWEEYIAGTDPVDADSGLVVVNVKSLANGTVEVSWPSVPGRVYRLERATSVQAQYATLKDDILADAPLNRYVDVTPAGVGAVYRVYVK